MKKSKLALVCALSIVTPILANAQVDYTAFQTAITAEFAPILALGLAVAGAGIVLFASLRGVGFAKAMFGKMSR